MENLQLPGDLVLDRRHRLGETRLLRLLREAVPKLKPPLPSRNTQSAVHTPRELEVCVHVLVRMPSGSHCSHHTKALIRSSSVWGTHSVCRSKFESYMRHGCLLLALCLSHSGRLFLCLTLTMMITKPKNSLIRSYMGEKNSRMK